MRHDFGMKQILTSAETEALKEVSKGQMQSVLPKAVTDALEQKELVRSTLGGTFRLTDKGTLALKSK